MKKGRLQEQIKRPKVFLKKPMEESFISTKSQTCLFRSKQNFCEFFRKRKLPVWVLPRSFSWNSGLFARLIEILKKWFKQANSRTTYSSALTSYPFTFPRFERE